jgi:hypothetical protein
VSHLPQSTVLAVRSALGRDRAQELLVTECCQLLRCERASIFLRDVKTDEVSTHSKHATVVL